MFVEMSQSRDGSSWSVRCWEWVWKNEDDKACVICESMNRLIANESMRHSKWIRFGLKHNLPLYW